MDNILIRTKKRDNTTDKIIIHYLGKITGTVFRWFFLICLSYIILYPIFYMVSMSFRSYTDFYDATVIWITKNWTLENFKILIDYLGYGDNLIHTTVITVFSTVCQLIITSMVGYGFGRYKFRGSNLLFVLVVFTIMVPQQMINLSTYLLFNDMDFFGIISSMTGHGSGITLLDSPLCFVLPAILGQGLRSGVFILIFRQIYAGLPKEIEEAAHIDGCNHLNTYIKIMMPNASNAFLIGGIFSVVWYWTDYYSTTTFLSSYRTIAMDIPGIRTALGQVLSAGEMNAYRFIPTEQAACLLLVLPLLIAFLLIQKFFSNSIDKTGLVG